MTTLMTKWFKLKRVLVANYGTRPEIEEFEAELLASQEPLPPIPEEPKKTSKRKKKEEPEEYVDIDVPVWEPDPQGEGSD